MNVTWPGHAQLFVNAANKTLLMDPWFAEPVFAGAWFRYPPPPFADSSMFPMPDFLLLSHTHPDHSGLATLLQLQKSIRVLAIDFASGGMRRRLSRAGLHNVHWVEPWKTEEIAPGLKVTFVPHNEGWEVASMIVEAEGVRLYHGNDNPLALEGYRAIARRLGPTDLAFLPYAGASAYPTGFKSDQATLEARCAAKKAEGLKRFTDGLEGLRPREAVPFASSWALLELSEVEKNFVDRPTAAEVLTQSSSKANDAGTKLLHMEPGDEWTPEAGVIRKGLTRGWDHDVASVKRYAEQERERVSRAIAQVREGHAVTATTEVLSLALAAYLKAFIEASAAHTASLRMVAGFSSDDGRVASRVVFGAKGASLEPGLKGDEDEVLRLPTGELAAVLFGELTWEDVWYGYRLKVTKPADGGYFKELWDALLGFDDEATSRRLRAELIKS